MSHGSFSTIFGSRLVILGKYGGKRISFDSKSLKNKTGKLLVVSRKGYHHSTLLFVQNFQFFPRFFFKNLKKNHASTRVGNGTVLNRCKPPDFFSFFSKKIAIFFKNSQKKSGHFLHPQRSRSGTLAEKLGTGPRNLPGCEG